MSQGYTELTLAPEQGEGHVTILPGRFSYITQGRWCSISNSVYAMYTLVYNPSQAINDRIEYYIWLSKGTYTLDLFQTFGNMGICTYYLDNVSLGAIDWYKADPAVYGYKNSITLITVSTSGRHILSIKLTGKSGSYYYAYIHSISMYRTA
jgi:hypothetical protein